MDESYVITNRYAVFNDDCIEAMTRMPESSIHFSVYSPPFAGLYHYSSSPRDLSNSRNYEEFFDHYEYVIEQLYRLTMPGRTTAVHCMDVPMGNTGGSSDCLMDFPGDIVEYHVRCNNPDCTASEFDRRRGLCGHGWWRFVARYDIWKEPLGVRNRTMAKKLAHQTIVEDSSKCGVAGADYLLVFRRAGENPVPIEHPIGLTDYAGSRQPPQDVLKYRGWEGKQIENKYSHWIWRQYASAFWDDIRIDNVLPYEESRDSEDERHIHPLQLDVIERAVTLWSNLGETVFTPFMGVGSEVYGAVKLGRKGVGVELKRTYFEQAVKNLDTIDSVQVYKPSLPGFEFLT